MAFYFIASWDIFAGDGQESDQERRVAVSFDASRLVFLLHLNLGNRKRIRSREVRSYVTRDRSPRCMSWSYSSSEEKRRWRKRPPQRANGEFLKSRAHLSSPSPSKPPLPPPSSLHYGNLLPILNSSFPPSFTSHSSPSTLSFHRFPFDLDGRLLLSTLPSVGAHRLSPSRLLCLLFVEGRSTG